jgi:site-specific recombinase XerD
MEKYRGHPKCSNGALVLPVLSNQKMNSYLKEIADVCKISKVLTFHIARHTFATAVALTHGVPIETVSKLLGHKQLRQTQPYAKIVDIKLSNDMQDLRSKLAAL